MKRSNLRAVLGVLAVVFSFTLLAAACGDDDDSGSSGNGGTPTTAAADNGDSNGGSGGGDAAAGKDLYASSCVSCHGADAKGLPKLGKDLVDSEFLDGLSDADAVAFIKQGRTAADPENTTGVDMPPKGGNPALNDDDINDIVAYLRSIAE